MPRIDRNQPCPCGSGRPFKHCCLSTRKLPTEQDDPAVAGPTPEPTAAAARAEQEQRAAAARRTAALAATRAAKERFYAEWVDQPLASLAGLTPRQAADHPRAWRKLEVVLKVKEHVERELPPEERYDFEALRRGLGLPR